MPLTQVSPGLLDSNAQYYGFKNRIINGDMRIDQRNNGASVSSSGSYPVDRFVISNGVTSWTAQRSTVAPAGFINSLLYTSVTGGSAASTDRLIIRQRVEGFNWSDFAWGTASAQSAALSFRVRSSLTGTFSGSIRNSNEDRSYPFSFTISAANTFEDKSITIPGDVTGTWETGNGTAIQLSFDMGSGTGKRTTAGAWVAGDYVGVTGAVSVSGTTGATFYITGVQLEKGSTATSFDYRPYGTELALCQRYYYRRTYPIVNEIVAVFQAYGAGAGFGKILDFPVTMRTSPTANVSSSSHFGPSNTTGNNQAVFTATTIDLVNPAGLSTGGWAGSSGLAAGNATVINARSTSAYIEASAEL